MLTHTAGRRSGGQRLLSKIPEYYMTGRFSIIQRLIFTLVDIHLYSQSQLFIRLDCCFSYYEYGFCYVLLFFLCCCCVSFRLCVLLTSCVITHIQQHSLFSVHTVCSRAHSSKGQYSHCCGLIQKVIFVIFFSLLKLILYSTQWLSLRKIITNTYNIKYYDLGARRVDPLTIIQSPI